MKYGKKQKTKKSTQLVFCDLSTPKSLGADDNPYEMELVNGIWKCKRKRVHRCIYRYEKKTN